MSSPAASRAPRRTAWILACSFSGGLLAGAGPDMADFVQRRVEVQTAHDQEVEVIAALKTLSSAQALYRGRHPKLVYGTLAELAQAGLIPSHWAQGTLSGFQLDVQVSQRSPSFEWNVVARPLRMSPQRRSFGLDQGGVIYPQQGGVIRRKADGSLDKPLRCACGYPPGYKH